MRTKVADHILIVSFDDEQRLLTGVHRLRAAGLQLLDVHTPYAVHGLSDALAMPPSRLPLATFIFGASGAFAIWWLQTWASATDWPLNVGGKPFDSLPAFFPAIFEMMVLWAGYGSVITLFCLCGLGFGNRARRNYEGATSDRFVVLVKATATVRNEAELRPLLDGCQPVAINQEFREGDAS